MFHAEAVTVTMATLDTTSLGSDNVAVLFDIQSGVADHAGEGLDQTLVSTDAFLTYQGTPNGGSAITDLSWLTGNGLVQFCTTVAGDVLAGATMVSGVSTTDADNTACMAAFSYRVDESNPSVT
jgi:hypothetical protein